MSQDLSNGNVDSTSLNSTSASPAPKNDEIKQKKRSSNRKSAKKQATRGESSAVSSTDDQTKSTTGEQKKPKKPNGNNKSRNNKDKSENSDKSPKNPKSKSKTPPKLLEVMKLTKRFKPLTVNGIPTGSLSKPYLEYIEDIINSSTSTVDDAIYLSFLMQPSDPDFPYDVSVLKISLCLPLTYPYKFPSPTISVLNDDIPKGFSVNIEIGFKQIVAKALENRANNRKQGKGNNVKPKQDVQKQQNGDEEDEDEEKEIEMKNGNDLLGMFLTLDKYLERFLAMEKKKTIKFVRTVRKKVQTEEITAPQSVKQAKAPLPDSKIPADIIAKRDKDIRKFKQRLQDDKIVLFKETSNSSIYRFRLSFQEENFLIEMNGDEEIEITNLPVKLTIPKEYLFNPKKPIRLEIDMSNRANLQMINAIEDKNARLVFGKLLNNMSANFNHCAADFAKMNCKEELSKSEGGEEKEKEKSDDNEIINPEEQKEQESAKTDESSSDSDSVSVSITSQLNFFVGNIEKFLNQTSDFNKWWEVTKEFNSHFVQST